MSSVRLFVLGALAQEGPMHGHQIRREAQISRTDRWTDVKVGSLYAALHRMEDEGLIEAVRTEQEGKLPARTVYAITAEGRRELHIHRDATLRDTRLRPDPVDLALHYSVELDEEKLRGILEDRRRELESELHVRRHQKESARPYTNAMEQALMDHSIVRLETELAWHDEVIDQLPKLLSGDR